MQFCPDVLFHAHEYLLVKVYATKKMTWLAKCGVLLFTSLAFFVSEQLACTAQVSPLSKNQVFYQGKIREIPRIHCV